MKFMWWLFSVFLILSSGISVWHLRNDSSPKTDEIEYVSSSYQAYRLQQSEGFLNAIQYVWQAGRPSSFQFILWPYLHIFEGNYKRAVVFANYSFYFIFLVFTSMLFIFLWGKTALTVLLVSLFGSLPIVIGNNFGFNVELPFLTSVMICVYFFVVYLHSNRLPDLMGLSAGIAWALTIRPMEAGLYLVIPVLAYFTYSKMSDWKEKWWCVSLVCAFFFLFFPITFFIYTEKSPPFLGLLFMACVLAMVIYYFTVNKVKNHIAWVLLGASGSLLFFYSRYHQLYRYVYDNTVGLMEVYEPLNAYVHYQDIFYEWSIPLLLIIVASVFLVVVWRRKLPVINSKRLLVLSVLLLIYLCLIPFINVRVGNMDTRYFFSSGLLIWLLVLWLVSLFVERRTLEKIVVLPAICLVIFLYSTALSDSINNIMPRNFIRWQNFQHSSKYPSLTDPIELVSNLFKKHILDKSARIAISFPGDSKGSSESWNARVSSFSFVNNFIGGNNFYLLDVSESDINLCESLGSYDYVLFFMSEDPIEAQKKYHCLSFLEKTEHVAAGRQVVSSLYRLVR